MRTCALTDGLPSRVASRIRLPFTGLARRLRCHWPAFSRGEADECHHTACPCSHPPCSPRACSHSPCTHTSCSHSPWLLSVAGRANCNARVPHLATERDDACVCHQRLILVCAVLSLQNFMPSKYSVNGPVATVAPEQGRDDPALPVTAGNAVPKPQPAGHEVRSADADVLHTVHARWVT